MEMYKKPVMDIIDLERIDVLTASCETCQSTGWAGTTHYANDGCNEGCTAVGHSNTTE
jgi:hypothetical protein